MRLDNQNKRSKMKIGFIMLVIQMMICTSLISAEPLPQVPSTRLGRGRAGSTQFSPDGKYLTVVASLQIELRSTQDWKPVAFIEGTSHDFSPDGKWLAYTRYSWENRQDTRIRLWDIETQRVKAILDGPYGYDLQFSPDSKSLAVGTRESVVLWNLQDLAVPRFERIKFPDGVRFRRLDFSPDGKRLAVGGFDGKIRIWDVASKQWVFTFEAGKSLVDALDFSPDGQRLASAHRGKIDLWDVPNRRHIQTLKDDPRNPVYSIAFQPDGKLLAVPTRTIELWDVKSGALVDILDGGISEDIVSFHPNGRRLASSGFQAVRIWDVSIRKVVKQIDYEDAFLSMALSPDGRFFAAGKSVWDISTGQLKFTHSLDDSEGVYTLDFQPNGNLLAVNERHAVALWNVLSGRLRGRIKVWEAFLGPLHFMPDGNALVKGSGADGIIRIWEIKKPRTPRLVGQHNLGAPIRHLDVSPDGQFLAVVSHANQIKIWNMSTQKLFLTLDAHLRSIDRIVFSPNGHLFASGDRDGTVHLWKLPDFQRWKTFSALEVHDFSPNSRYLILESRNNIEILDIASEEMVATLPGYGTNFRFSPTGEFIAALSSGFIELWATPPQTFLVVEGKGKFVTTWGQVKRTELLQNYPNPFNPETWLPFQLATPSRVTIEIHDPRGQLIRTLPLGWREAGAYHAKTDAARWNGRSETGESVANGIYLYTLTAGDETATKKMILLK